MRRITSHGYPLPNARGKWSVNVWADGHGVWQAEVRRLDLDGNDVGILHDDGRLKRLARQTAKNAMIDAITRREQKTTESFNVARMRVRSTFGPLARRVIYQSGSRVRLAIICYSEATP